MKGRSRGQRAEQVTHCDEIPQGVLLYTKAQMAAALQVSVRCVTGMMYRGDLNFLKINGHMVRFRPEEALRRLNETSGVSREEPKGAKGKSEEGPRDNGPRDNGPGEIGRANSRGEEPQTTTNHETHRIRH